MAVPSGSPSRHKSRSAANVVPRKFKLETHVFYLFSRILASRNRALNIELARLDLDFPRWRVMAVLHDQPGSSMLQLAELTSVDRTTLAHTVGLMVAERLIRREARPSDRRSVTLTLTPRGSGMFARVLPVVMTQNQLALAGFNDADTDALRMLLRRVLSNLEN